MITTWRWDRSDQLPSGRQLGTVAQPDPGNARLQRAGCPGLIASLRGRGQLADDGQGVITNPAGLQFGLQFTAVRLRSTKYAPLGWPAARTHMNPNELAPLKLLIRGLRPQATESVRPSYCRCFH
jgi:hypothetical protein